MLPQKVPATLEAQLALSWCTKPAPSTLFTVKQEQRVSVVRRCALLAAAPGHCGGHHMTGLRLLAWKPRSLAERNELHHFHGIVGFGEDMC